MASTAPITGSSPGMIRTWLIDHERLIIIGILAVGLWFGVGKVQGIIAAHDDAALKQATIVANQQAAQNATLATQVQADKAQLQALTDKLSAQNQQLANANTALATALAGRQKTDATLPPTDLALRWAQLTPTMPPAGVTVASDGTMKVTQAGAVATTQQLEKVPVLTTELANETTQKQNDDQLLAAANKSLLDETNLYSGAVKLDTDHQAQCQDQIKVVKDQAAKSKRRWFIIGYVAGFLTREFTLK